MKTWDPIFKAGTHTSSTGITREWTETDLDQLVHNTGKDIPIVIHHPADQSKAVNFGKIASLKRVGAELMAQYQDVPEILSMAVKEGLKLGKSVSIDPVNMIIRHVGLLGAGQPPAVDGLGAASFAAGAGTDNNGDKVSLTYTFNQDRGTPPKQTKEPVMDPKDLKIKELEDKLAAMEADKTTETLKADLEHAKADLKAEKEAHDATRTEFSKFTKKQEAAALKARVEALTASGRILPAEAEKVLAFAAALPKDKATMEFSAPDGKKETVTPRELYLRDLEARQPDREGLLNEFAKAGHAGRGSQEDDTPDFKDINSFA